MTKCISLIQAMGVLGAVGVISMTAAAETAKPMPPIPPSTTISLALTGWRYAFYETDYAKEECPDGLQVGESKQFAAMPDLETHQQKVGGNWQTRGPNGETGDNNPLTVDDPIAFREYKGTRAYGFNMDGTQDGHATAKTCQHVKFTNPEGEKVDNQIQRVIGCVQGWRTSGGAAEYLTDEMVRNGLNRILIEITDVDNEVNDPSVQVTFYKGRDRLVRSQNGFVPYLPQRIDDRLPGRYVMKTTGKIVDGVLITAPVPDGRFSTSQNDASDRVMKDMTVRLKLTADGGDGYISAYEDIGKWYNVSSKKVTSDVGLYSNAALYRAVHRYADGYPDANGECQYISSQFKVSAVRATIVHTPKDPRVAQSETTSVASAQN